MVSSRPEQLNLDPNVLLEVCEASSRGVLIASQDGFIIHINRRFIEALNINPDLEIGKPLRNSGIFGVTRRADLTLLVDENKPFEFTNRLRKGNDDMYWNFTGNVFPAGYIIEGEDVTEQVLKLEEAEQRERKYEQKIAIAQRLQRDLFPSNFQKKRIDIHTHLMTADDLAGDFFSITELSPNAIGVVIGDVVGKGIPASLMAMSIHTLFMQEAKLMRSPSELLTLINGMLHSRFKGDFWYATAFYAKILVTKLSITYSRAGHEFPLLFRNATGKIEELTGQGLPLGMFPSSHYETRQVNLNEGDKLLLFTDGLPDAVNPRGERFGHERLKLFLERNGNNSAEEILEDLKIEIEDFCEGEPHVDDIAISVFAVVPDLWTTWAIPPRSFEELLNSVFGELEEIGVDEDTQWYIRLALDECIINAQRHGNKRQFEQPVHLSYLINPNKITFKIRDSGEGFDYENLPDPTLENNVMNEFGRGVFLTRKFMDEVSFNEIGNEITITKHFQPRT
jgi:serine phosphatase RsbU (regulator of sigma subunit)/anti-sigma regulatory factor (Ser/Thr protein kinase)